jgi:single-strand DNA-binding protein
MFHTMIAAGNLGREPEMRYTNDGQPVTNFPLACNRQYTNGAGQTVKETIWFRITVWGKQAENCNQYLHKGSKVLIEGRLTPDPATGAPRVWESNGRHGASYEITASRVTFMSPKEASEEIPSPEEELVF